MKSSLFSKTLISQTPGSKTLFAKVMGSVLCFWLTACASTSVLATQKSGKPSVTVPGSFADGNKGLAQRLNARQTPTKAKNVILFIGDGMGVSTVTAMRIHAGQKNGMTGEEYVLTMDRFPHLALAKTYNTDQQVSDSAGTASAIMTGQKTRAGVLNISPAVKKGDCANALKAQVPTLFEQASQNGLSTGIVSTARITHATPAAAYAKSPHRNWESDKDLPESARNAGCRSIAAQMQNAITSGTLDLVLGGGNEKFPKEFMDTLPGTKLISGADLSATDRKTPLPIVGLFSQDHMAYMASKKPNNTEPSLSEMTRKAVSRLENTQGGYVLMVEGGRIDHGHHAGKAELALEEGIEFDRAVKAAVDLIDPDETLIIVTADHSHVFTIAGYPTRGNPILGTVIGNDKTGTPKTKPTLANDGLPYTTLGYQNGIGATKGERSPMLNSGQVIIQKAAIPTDYETHAGEDVPVFAIGPSSDLVSGVMEQNTIYHIMRHALGF